MQDFAGEGQGEQLLQLQFIQDHIYTMDVCIGDAKRSHECPQM